MILEDYDKIKVLIDEIIGIDTKQGENLKFAIKNYFETKPVIVKFPKEVNSNSSYNMSNINESLKPDAKKALTKYTEKIKINLAKLKKKKEYCGVSG